MIQHDRLTLFRWPNHVAVVQLPPQAPLPAEIAARPFFGFIRTAAEVTLIVDEAAVASEWDVVERDWRVFEVEGPLDFSLTGILAGLSHTLAAAGISLFALSTYATDLILVRAADAPRAADAWRAAGHTVREAGPY